MNEIEEVCVVGLGIAQPMCLIQLSEIGKSTLGIIFQKCFLIRLKVLIVIL